MLSPFLRVQAKGNKGTFSPCPAVTGLPAASSDSLFLCRSSLFRQQLLLHLAPDPAMEQQVKLSEGKMSSVRLVNRKRKERALNVSIKRRTTLAIYHLDIYLHKWCQ